MSYEYSKENKTMDLDSSDGSDWGKYITAGSVINDAPMQYGGRTWPKNDYGGYRGQMRLRKALEQSVNVCAVKIFQQIGADYSSSMLKKVGISTLDEEGDVNDLNPAALALGGLTYGALLLKWQLPMQPSLTEVFTKHLSHTQKYTIHTMNSSLKKLLKNNVFTMKASHG